MKEFSLDYNMIGDEGVAILVDCPQNEYNTEKFKSREQQWKVMVMGDFIN